MTQLDEFKKDLPLIFEAGLLAIKQGDEESAKKLFGAIGILEPQGTLKTMGLGLIALHKMDLKNAKSLFKQVLDSDAKNYRAQAFLSFASVLSAFQPETSNPEKEKALIDGALLAQGVLDNCDIPSTCALAQSVLDWEIELNQKAAASKGPVK